MKEEHIGAAGQGQGLFICKHVIESIHNGEIFAESAPGKGTTFVIKVPLADLEG
jgi:signal transduction histidine kinase